ncbi:MAG: O-antigen ligase family protein [Thermoguttaceae bacterium]|nr:O-antigen ligase family protein [Thermoguttaceae bacterium]
MNRPNRRRPAAQAVKTDSTAKTAATGAASRFFPAAFAFGLAATLVPILVSAPEGAVREGDFNPVALLFLFFAAAVSVAALRFPLLSNDKIDKTAKSNVDEAVPLDAANAAAPALPTDKTNPTAKTDKLNKIARRAVRVADVALVFFLAWATASYLALIFGQTGDVRFATNAYWLFATPTLLYFFARRFRSFFDSRLISSVCVLIFAVAVAESLHSFYSLTVATPRLRAAYLADPEGVLAANGMSFSSAAERTRFENRLLESSEPTGTFGLANTLAGLLAPTFVFGAAAFVSAVSRRRRSRRAIAKNVKTANLAATDSAQTAQFPQPVESVENAQTSDPPRLPVPGVATLAVWAAALGLVLFVLLATKSRSGFLGATFGVGVWGVLSFLAALRRAERKTARRVAFGTFGAFVGAVLLLVGAFATGLLDREVFAEAGKSLGYRLDYWRSTAAMIADSPLLGVGPGEFQSVYARYISPTASEFIADPHSFAFELAALFGVPALAAFLAFLAALATAAVATVLTVKLDAQPNQPNQPNQNNQNTSTSPTVKTGLDVPFVVGAFFGVLLAFAASLFQTAPLDGAFVGSAFVAFALIFPTVSSATLRSDWSSAALLGALAAAFLNLCAAGGIGYPALTFPIFLLAAFLVNRADATAKSPQLVETAEKADLSASTQTADVPRTSQTAVPPQTAQIPRRPANVPLYFALGAVAVAAVFDATAFRPWAAEFFFSLRISAPNGAAQYRDVFEAGAPEKIDAASHEVVSQCYYAAGKTFATRPTPENRARWERLRAQAQAVSPNSASLREGWADFDASLFADVSRGTRREFLDSAVDFYRQAVDRSPTDAAKRAKLVAALRDVATLSPPTSVSSADVENADFPFPTVAAETALDDARRQAEIALELDAKTPHLDRKLPDETRADLRRFLDAAP